MLSRDKQNDFLVIVPTMAEPHLVECVRRLIIHGDGQRLRVVLSVNAADVNDPTTIATVARCRDLAFKAPAGVRIDIVEAGGPLGFGGAVNAGLRYAATMGKENGVIVGGIPRMTVVLNDDAQVTAGWLTGMRAALDTETIRTWGEPGNPDRPASAYGKIGLVGPASNNAAGIQHVPVPEHMLAGGIDQFAYHYRQSNVNNYIAADFLSGFCLGLSDEALTSLITWRDGDFDLFDERFGIGGFEDNDLLVRAEIAGFRAVVAGDVYVHHVGHATLDKRFPGQKRGLANRAVYYDKWKRADSADVRVCAVYRIKLETPHDVYLLRASLAKVGSIVDRVAILLTGNPADVLPLLADPEESGLMFQTDAVAFAAMRKMTDVADVARAFEDWARDAAGDFGTPPQMKVAACDWSAPMNERLERNAAFGLAESMGAEWILSVDADEVPEDRWTRRHIQRLVRHPDPMVRSWDFGWLNHWDSPRLVRTDAPWSDGDRYATGMRGFRLWRVCTPSPRRILAGNAIGLHCGNSPDHDPLAKRVAGLRFRHFGYLRDKDRRRKHARYTRIDPNPDAALTGGGYGHLIREEGMRVCPYVANDGIGLHMLVWEGEDPENVARWLDSLYGVVDEIVLVWTGTWDAAPVGRAFRPLAAWDDASTGATPDPMPATPGNGPSDELLRIASAFGAAWLHRPLADDIAGARNAGIDALDEIRKAGGVGAPERLGWALFVDPDEVLSQPFDDCVALRRMAEASDSWGWLFVFANRVHGQEQPAFSESVRMSRLDPEGVMRLDGRVHEGFRKATKLLRDRGVSMQLRYAPFVCANHGIGGLPEQVQAKLERYDRLLRLQLADDPTDVSAWTSLALQYFNDDRIDEGEACLKIATMFADGEFLPFRELAFHHVRVAQGLLAKACELTASQHRGRRALDEALAALRSVTGPVSRVGIPGKLPPKPLPEIPDALVEQALAKATR